MKLSNALLISSLLFTLGGCCGGKSEPASRWDTPGGGAGKPATTATATATTKATATATATATTTATATADKPKADAKPLDKTTANSLFPADGTDGFKCVFKVGLPGYWESNCKKGTDELNFSVVDNLIDKKADFTKFAAAPDKLGGFPYSTTGSNKNQILVNGHVLLTASSKTLDEKTRKTWLQKFNTSSVP
jgi:hypothetical protein